MIDPSKTAIIYIGGESILAEKNDTLIQYSYLSDGSLVYSLSKLFQIQSDQISTLIYGNEDSACKVFERTANKLYIELIDNQIYVRSKPDMHVTNFESMDDINSEIDAFEGFNFIIFFEDHGDENVFSKLSYISLYRMILSCKPLSVRIFNESCSSGGFIKCMKRYDNIFNLLKFSNSQSQVDIRNIKLYTRMLNSSHVIKESLTETFFITSQIQNLYMEKPTEINKVFNILRNLARKRYEIIQNLADDLEITDARFYKTVKCDNYLSLLKLGIKTVHEIKLLSNVINYIYVNTDYKITSFSEFVSFFNEDINMKYISLVNQFDSEDEFNDQINYYFMGDVLYLPVKDFKVVTSSSSKNSSFTFPSFRINPVTKVISGTPLIASAIEEVFLNISHNPISTSLIETKTYRSEYGFIEYPIDKEKENGNKYCRWLQAFLESYVSCSTCDDRLFIHAEKTLKEKAAVMRVATEIISIIIKDVQGSIGQSSEVQIQIPKSSSKDRMKIPKDTVIAAIAEKRLQTMVGLSAVIPFASNINQTELRNMMSSYRINNQQRIMIKIIKTMDLSPVQMAIESERTVKLITDIITDSVEQEQKNNIAYIDAINTLIEEEAFVVASISSLFQLLNDHELVKPILFNLNNNVEFANSTFIAEVIHTLNNSKLARKESELQIIRSANEIIKNKAQNAIKYFNTSMEDVIDKIIHRLIDNERFVPKQALDQYLASFDKSDVDKAKKRIKYLCKRAAGIVFDNIDTNSRSIQEAILDDKIVITSRFPDACEAVTHFIDPSVYLLQMLLEREKELANANDDSADDPKIILLKKQISSISDLNDNNMNENTIANSSYKAAYYLSKSLKKHLHKFIKAIKEIIDDHDFNLASIFEIGAQILSDERIVRNKLNLMCDQLLETDIKGIVSIASMIARSIRTHVAITVMSASIPREPDEIKGLLPLSDDTILAEASKSLSKLRFDIEMELDRKEAELVSSVSYELLKNKSIAEMAKNAAFEVLINTQLLNEYPVEFVVKFMKKLRKCLSKEEIDMCQKALVNVTRNDIIHLLGLTRFQMGGKPSSSIRYIDKRADPDSFDYSAKPPQPTAKPEISEYDSDDEESYKCCTQFLPVHFEHKEPKLEKQYTSFVRKPISDSDFIKLTSELHVPQKGWGPDIIKVIDARFQKYVSLYGLSFDKSKVVRCNDDYFILAEVEAFKILPLYNIMEYKENKLYYAGLFVQNRNLQKELFDCFVQSVDDADRLVTPFYFRRLQYYKY